jgi:type I restriction enzyme R subunit
VPPPEPEDASAPLRIEIEALQKKLADSESAAEIATKAAEAEARERETLQQRLKREAEERAVWEQLAQEAEAAKAEIASRLASLQSEAKDAPKADVVALVQRGEEVARHIDLDEADTRDLIDQQLRDNRWDADTKQLRYSAGTRPSKGRNMAIAEWPTASGPADYALFAGLKLALSFAN